MILLLADAAAVPESMWFSILERFGLPVLLCVWFMFRIEKILENQTKENKASTKDLIEAQNITSRAITAMSCAMTFAPPGFKEQVREIECDVTELEKRRQLAEEQERKRP